MVQKPPMAVNILIWKNHHGVRKSPIQHRRQRQILIWHQPMPIAIATATVPIHHRQVDILNSAAQNIYHNHIINNSYHHHRRRRRPLHHPCVNSFLMRLVHDANQSVSVYGVRAWQPPKNSTEREKIHTFAHDTHQCTPNTHVSRRFKRKCAIFL